MPITITGMSPDQMSKAVKQGRRCGKCDRLLTIRNGAYFGYEGDILSCGDMSHNTIAGFDKEYEQSTVMKEIRKMQSKALTEMPEEKMLARIGMAKFPQDLTRPEKELLATIAITYGFDPLMGEVTIYQGRPFVSIDGRYRKAQETGCLDGIETRPATKEERGAWEIPDGDYFFRAEVYRTGAHHPFVGWGRVRKSETTGGKGFKPVETNPQRMAEKRAEAQSLRKAFHIPLPSLEDIGSPDIEVTVDEPKPGAIEAPSESKATAQVTEATPAQPATNESPAQTEVAGEKKPVQYKRDPASITTIEHLAKALKEDYQLTYQQQWKELNIANWQELSIKPSEAYIQVAAARH